jgi:hypothetical protein
VSLKIVGNNKLNFLNEEICSLLTLTTLTVEDNPLYTDPVTQIMPKGVVSSLLEITAEHVMKLENIDEILSSQALPRDLETYLQSSKLCSQCYGILELLCFAHLQTLVTCIS